MSINLNKLKRSDTESKINFRLLGMLLAALVAVVSVGYLAAFYKPGSLTSSGVQAASAVTGPIGYITTTITTTQYITIPQIVTVSVPQPYTVTVEVEKPIYYPVDRVVTQTVNIPAPVADPKQGMPATDAVRICIYANGVKAITVNDSGVAGDSCLDYPYLPAISEFHLKVDN